VLTLVGIYFPSNQPTVYLSANPSACTRDSDVSADGAQGATWGHRVSIWRRMRHRKQFASNQVVNGTRNICQGKSGRKCGKFQKKTRKLQKLLRYGYFESAV
jgi:hypothetical protein